MGPGSDGPMGALEPHHMNGSLGKTWFSIATRKLFHFFTIEIQLIESRLICSSANYILTHFLTGSGDIDGIPKVLLK